jgi:hypothetical protein
MGLNVYLSPSMQVDGATSISIISLVDINVKSSHPYLYVYPLDKAP